MAIFKQDTITLKPLTHVLNLADQKQVKVVLPTDFSPPDGIEVYYQPTVVNWFHDDIYHIHALPGVSHTLKDATLQTDLMHQLFGNKKVKVLIDLRDVVPMEYAARKHYGTEEGKRNNGYTAVVTSSAFTRAMANFLLGSFKSSLKTKMFLNVEDAVKWLHKKG